MLQKMRLIQGCALAAVTVLAACGGGGSSKATNNAPIAVSQLGQANFTDLQPNQQGVPAANTLNAPGGNVATNGTVFYIADTNNNRILGYTSLPSTADAPAQFVIGQASLTSNVAGSGATGLAHPTKVAIAGTKLVIVDTSNNRVLILDSLPTANVSTFDPAHTVVVGQTSLAGSSSGLTDSTLNNPTGAIIAGNKLFVADKNNNRVLIWNTVPTASGAAASVVLGQPNFTSNVANCAYSQSTALPTDPCNTSFVTPSQSSLSQPSDVWSDGFYLIVSDTSNNRALFWTQVPTTPHVNADYVLGQTTFTGNFGNIGGSASLRAPFGVWSDGSYIFVADLNNNRVVAYNYPATQGTAASLVYGQGDMTHAAANDDNQNNVADTNTNGTPVATDRTLNAPQGVFTFNGKVYVSDTHNHRIMIYNY